MSRFHVDVVDKEKLQFECSRKNTSPSSVPSGYTYHAIIVQVQVAGTLILGADPTTLNPHATNAAVQYNSSSTNQLYPRYKD